MMLKIPANRPVAAALAVVAVAGVGTAIALMPAVHSRAWLAIGLVGGIAAHVFLSRGVKAVLSAVSPLANGAPEAASYQRSVWGTPGRPTQEIVALAVAASLVLGAGLTLDSGWVGTAGVVALLVALGLDIHRWERVATSADWVWFQRGFGQKVHQVAIENIRDISVQEEDADGFTLRHGHGNRMCRLNLRMNDKRVVALPKTDAHTDIDAVEIVANHIRARQELAQSLASRRRGGSGGGGGDDLDAAPPPPPVSPDAGEEAMQRELRRLRRQAMADAGTRRPPKS